MSSEGPLLPDRRRRPPKRPSANPAVLDDVRSRGQDYRHPDQSRVAFYTTKPGGLGMGLSISRSIMDGHRGRLWATANPGHGATFHFALPRMR
jgi:nitrogen fixation/metabolism regulation signal transduction histidine kinase